MKQVSSSLEKYNIDWRKQYQGHSCVVLKPRTTEQISQILQFCGSRRLPLVPQGGNTGLVGGSVPVRQELVLSLERMNRIYHTDTVSGIIYCQAGCILQHLQQHAAFKGLLVPLDLGSKGTCQLGGNISTNAGGHYYYRYGSLAANLVGAQVVLASGDVLNLNFHHENNDNNMVHSNLKDNTGYKLHSLFLGAEGTLGIVTAVALKCPPLPQSTQAAFLTCSSFQNVLRLISLAKQELGEILAALEWMDPAVLKVIQQQKQLPISQSNKTDNSSHQHHALLLETHGSNAAHDVEKLNHFLEWAMRIRDDDDDDEDHPNDNEKDALVTDGVVAQDLTQVAEFWNIREAANPSVAALGYGYKYDLSLPISQWDSFLRTVQRHIQQQHPNLLCTNWGHVLDGNLHLNFTTPREYQRNPQVEEFLEPFIYNQIQLLGGSISAEHGIGQAKRKELLRVHDPAILRSMWTLKQALDPVGILNPHKVLPPPSTT